MKKLLRIVLPPLVGFAAYFAAVRYSPFYFSLRIDEMGKGNLLAFMSFYRYTLPLLFVVAVLTQLLIVIPIWRGLKEKSTSGKIWEAVSLIFVCSLLAAGMSYAIWDKEAGLHHLIVLFCFMAAVQLVYWLINLIILKLLD